MEKQADHMSRNEVYRVIGWLIGTALTISSIIIILIFSMVNGARQDMKELGASIQQAVGTLKDEAATHVTRISVLETEQGNTDKSLVRLEQKVDSLLKLFNLTIKL